MMHPKSVRVKLAVRLPYANVSLPKYSGNNWTKRQLDPQHRTWAWLRQQASDVPEVRHQWPTQIHRYKDHSGSPALRRPSISEDCLSETWRRKYSRRELRL